MGHVIRTRGVEQTPVIFRKYADGEILALFPSLPSPHGGPTACKAYTKSKGEITSDIAVMRVTTAATPEEYMETFGAVANAGFYPLKIVQRIKGHLNETRNQTARKTKGRAEARAA